MNTRVALGRLCGAVGVAVACGVVLGLTPVERAHAGACARFRHYTSGFGAPAGSALPANGGVLFVPTLADGQGEGNAFLRRSGPPLESLRRGGGALTSTRVELAPGWVIVRPESPMSGRITAMAGSSRRAFTMTRENGAPLAAAHTPDLRYVGSVVMDTPRGSRSSSPYNALTLGHRAPAGAYAVVVRRAAAGAEPARPYGFALRIEEATQTTFTFSSRSGRCQPNPPGSILAADTDVEVLFVSVNGRLSPPVITRVR